MSRSCVFIAFLMMATAATTAQEIPKVELFGGYAFGRVHTGDFNNPHANLNGWSLSSAYNLNRWFGIVAEASGLYGSKELTPASTIVFVCQPNPTPCPAPIHFGPRDQSHIIHTYSIGPRFSYRNHSRYTPFVDALFGGGYISDHLAIGSTSGRTQANGASALTAGAGVDIGLTQRLALRTQADFLRPRFFHQNDGSLRVSSGLVFRFGHK